MAKELSDTYIFKSRIQTDRLLNTAVHCIPLQEIVEPRSAIMLNICCGLNTNCLHVGTNQWQADYYQIPTPLPSSIKINEIEGLKCVQP